MSNIEFDAVEDFNEMSERIGKDSALVKEMAAAATRKGDAIAEKLFDDIIESIDTDDFIDQNLIGELKYYRRLSKLLKGRYESMTQKSVPGV